MDEFSLMQRTSFATHTGDVQGSPAAGVHGFDIDVLGVQ